MGRLFGTDGVRGVANRELTAELAPSVRTAVEQAAAELGDTGRILLRPSGTEPMIRVMVEAADEGVAQRLAATVADAVSTAR